MVVLQHARVVAVGDVEIARAVHRHIARHAHRLAVDGCPLPRLQPPAVKPLGWPNTSSAVVSPPASGLSYSSTRLLAESAT